jgi:hypothetical protein
MRKIWKDLYNSRVGQYLTFMFIFLIFYKIFGFELSVILFLSIIIGEMHYKDVKKL